MNSVGLELRFCLLKEAFGHHGGNGVVAPPEMISSGPRAGLRVSVFTWVHGSRFANAAWNRGRARPGDVEGLVELSGLLVR